MPLTFNLPPTETEPAAAAQARPAALARWLDETLRRDPVDAARLLGDALGTFNGVELPDARRLESTERCRAAASQLWPHLEAKYARASHPMTGRALEAAKGAIGLGFELTVAYKRMLVRQSGKRLVLGGTRQLVLLLNRALEATERVLVASYLAYAPVPPKTWLDAHAIYAFALERDLAQRAIPHDDPAITPERTYVQMLLLALANPYGFVQGDLGTVIGYVRHAWQWAKLTEVPPVHRMSKAVAIVPIGHDFPPFAANKGGAIEGSKAYLLTHDLAFELQAQLQKLEAGAPAPADVENSALARLQYIAVLRRLLRQWAIPPARQFNRVPSRARVLMCPGLPAAWQNIVNARAGAREVPAGLPPMTHAQVINHTPAGYALRQTDAAPAALRIGELIAVKVEGRTGIQLAMIRWFRNTLKGSGLEFGCELVSERPEAAVARAEGASDVDKTPVIVLPEELGAPANPGASPQLIVPSGAFGVEHALAIERDREKLLAVLTKLVEHGPGFELYDYAAVG